jgi:hypothetical protein
MNPGALASGGIHMVIADTTASQPFVPDLRFKTAGWISFLGIMLIIPTLAVTIISIKVPPMLLIYIPLTLLGDACSIYISIEFRRLLNKRYDFHGVDQIITAQIIITLIMAVIDNSSRIVTALIPPLGFIAVLSAAVLIGGMIVAGILGIIEGVRLLAIQDSVSGLLRSYAIIGIICSSCVCTIILFPIACLLIIPSSIILGMMFLRAAGSEAQVEFV